MRLIFLALFSLITQQTTAQRIDRLIREKYVRDVLTTLASDDMQGRKPLTAGIEKAAAFISAEFSKAGLKPLHKDSSGFLQRFSTYQSVVTEQSLQINGTELPKADVLVFASEERTEWVNGGAEVRYLGKGGNPMQEVYPLLQGNQNLLLIADTSQRRSLARLRNFRMQRMGSGGTIILAFHTGQVDRFEARVTARLTRNGYANVVGMIPGKGRPEEMVLFSAHYDHLGIGKAVNEDSVYNGANDDASGTTAVIALARYFSRLKQPERTLVFAAFTAEESGGYGSKFFSQQLAPEKVMAMFNIEMIGTESKWGRNSAYITGFERTDFGTILQENLKGSGFSFYPDPYPAQNLFYRSDNATLAELGVPAHTISTSKMDSEKYYHTVDDEISTLDIGNMTQIIKSIALSGRTIVAGKSTPGRVK